MIIGFKPFSFLLFILLYFFSSSKLLPIGCKKRRFLFLDANTFKQRNMIRGSRSRSLRFLLLFSSISLHFISGFSNESASSKNDAKTKPNVSSSSSSGLKVVLILLGIVAIGLFSFYLFKLWRKKKREEQYARLLKLFEQDDELEVELGLKD